MEGVIELASYCGCNSKPLAIAWLFVAAFAVGTVGWICIVTPIRDYLWKRKMTRHYGEA